MHCSSLGREEELQDAVSQPAAPLRARWRRVPDEAIARLETHHGMEETSTRLPYDSRP